MSVEPETAAAGQPASAAPFPVNVTPSGREALKLYEREIATYLRELPRLLDEGHAGRHTLIKGEEVLGIWDTDGEAIEAGRERFGLEPIFVKKIDPRDPQRFALLEAWLKSQCPS